MKLRVCVALALLSTACRLTGQAKEAGESTAGPARVSKPVEEARAMIDAGEFDAALARLQGAPDAPDALYYQGVAWARKAERAPLPTPPPAAPGEKPSPPPEFKPEEQRALEFFERAVQERPDHGPAHLGIAQLLAPHATRRHQLEEAVRKRPVRRGKRREPEPEPEPTLRPMEGTDYSPGRVIAAYQKGAQPGPSAKEALEALVRFSLRVERREDAEWALQEMVRRDKENPEPLIRYGDFLLNEKKDPHEAITQYRQALIWRPDDDATRGKVADIYIDMGRAHYEKNEYSLAEARFLEAQKYVTDKTMPQALKIQDHLNKLYAIRPPGRR